MKKRIVTIFSIIILVIAILGTFILYFSRTHKIKDSYNFKSIYNEENYDNIQISFIDIFNNETTDVMSKEDVTILLNTLKDQNIKYGFYTPSTAPTGGIFKLKITNTTTGKSFKCIIRKNTLKINEFIYDTENNIVELLDDVISKYNKYFY